MNNNFENISVVIIIKNAENTIYDVLKSLSKFSNVVVYDNGSTDKTLDVIESFNNVNLILGEFHGFGPTKKLAATFAKNDWILSLDSDEVISKELLKNLEKINLDDNFLYQIRRRNYYKEYKIKYCGWGEEVIPRLYNRNKTNYNDSLVHEKVLMNNLRILTLNGELKHYPYFSISQFIQKADSYSSMYAEENKGIKSSNPLKAYFNAIYSFIKTYFFKRGFMDGYIGLVISFSHMTTNFYKYIKLYEKNKEM